MDEAAPLQTPRTPRGGRLRPPPLYESEEGEQELGAHYTAALASLPFSHEERFVVTHTFGHVHVVAAGPPTAPPLVLWHGTAAPAPFALAAFQPLTQHFRVYAPDIPCQAGSRSEAVVLDQATHDHGRWCAEVVEALGLLGDGGEDGSGSDQSGGAAGSDTAAVAEEEPGGAAPDAAAAGAEAAAGAAAPAAQPPRPAAPLHVGVSVGGAMLLDMALVRPEAIAGAALLAPGCLHPECDSKWLLAKVVAQAGLTSALYRLLPCRWTAWLATAGTWDEWQAEGDPQLEQVKLAYRHQAYFPPPPLKFTDEQLGQLGAPTLVIAAEHDLFGPGAATAERAQRALPDCETLVLAGARHVPGRAAMQEANGAILSFFAARGLAPAGAAAAGVELVAAALAAREAGAGTRTGAGTAVVGRSPSSVELSSRSQSD